jgi:rifampicin phosphotransferase
MSTIRSLSTLSRADFHLAGGKAVNLGEMLQADLPVPGGFVVTTDAYRRFVAENDLEGVLCEILQRIVPEVPMQLEGASEQLRAAFQNARIPVDMQDDLCRTYAALGEPALPVAVRSSATAEDLPDLSFAGQQDTYLNIIGEEALLKAVVNCWASLWTSRAIAYRAYNHIPNEGIALAVVVQEMVQSEVSGVLFTANPLSGKRGETVIDATFGLGEALVSGQVEPDHYVIETARGNILVRQPGSKALRIDGKAEGGTITLQQADSQRLALTDDQLRALALLGQRAAHHFGSPQDIEWAMVENRLLLLQSRAITTLYPLPQNAAAEPLEVFFSFGVWQGMLEPYTPLGQSAFTDLVSGLGRMFGSSINPSEQRVLIPAGERLFVEISSLFHSSFGRMFLGIFTSAIDPVSSSIVAELMKDERLQGNGRISLAARLRLVRGIIPFAKNILFNLLFPERGRNRLERVIQSNLSRLQQACDQARNVAELDTTTETVSMKMIADMFPVLVAAVASGMGMPYQVLTRMSAGLPGCDRAIMDLSRGLPYNVTMEMDLSLWKIAADLREQADICEHFLHTDIAHLVGEFQSASLPEVALQSIRVFLDGYGMRGVGEIDLGRMRWQDDPTPVFQILKSYLQIDPSKSPDTMFHNGEAVAKKAAGQLLASLTTQPGGKLKVIIARFFIRRFRVLGGLRESPKFAIVRMFGIYRAAYRSFGREYVKTGIFKEADDIFFLHPLEIKALAAGTLEHVQALVAERRETYQREFRRKRIPRVLLSDGTAFYDAIETNLAEDENTLIGNPVSAGSVEGIVHVVFEPLRTQILPGEILVCPATDPAWTPLFLSAGGLVMEVGGMVTHGSVVAREYGIPAVVGVKMATQRLKNGQLVRVDGSSGRITILKDR